MKKKFFIIFLLFFVFNSTAQAHWHCPISAGDQVIDLKRLSDSIKVTTQVLTSAVNTIANLKNRILFNTKISSEFTKLSSLISNFNNPLSDTKITNTYTSYNSTYFTKNFNKLRTAMSDNTLEKKLSAALNTTNTQSDEMYQQIVQHENSRQETISNLVELKDDGLLSEKQKNNAINITNAIALSERARLIGTKLTDNATSQNAKATISRLDAEKSKAGSTYAYDPYNPSDYDTKNKETTSTNYGFLNFGE